MNLLNTYICKICGNNKGNRIYHAKEMMLGLKHEFVYFECSECECLQIADIPENIGDYYPSHYYSFKKVKNKWLKNLSDSLVKQKTKASILPLPHLAGFLFTEIVPSKHVKFLKGIINNVNDRILDVGCGNGQKFLFPLFHAGFKNVEGCDPFLEKSEVDAHGPNLYKKELTKMNGEWDVITFNHSFEHLPNPSETLDAAYNLLADNGYCVIRIPTVSSFAWKHYKVDWFQLDAPRHFFLHSVKSIQLLAEISGFSLVKKVSDSTHHQFTISERYKNGKTLQERNYNSIWGRLVHVGNKFRYSWEAKKLNNENRGDQAVFYLQKN